MTISESTSIREAYHFTAVGSLVAMIDAGKFNSSIAYGDDREEALSKGLKYPYYISTTQYKSAKEGYGKGRAVRLELDVDYLSNKGIFRRVVYGKGEDYYLYHMKASGEANQYYESEDRFLTRHSHFPFEKAVKSIYVFGKLAPYRKALEGLCIGMDVEVPVSDICLKGRSGKYYFKSELSSAFAMLSALKGGEYARKKYSELGFPETNPSSFPYLDKHKFNEPFKLMFSEVINDYMKRGRKFSELISDIESALGHKIG